jgi:hypothetical protein
MNLASVATALVGGLFFGYLAIRILDSLLGIGFCLHGLLIWRWKRLAVKVATGVAKPENILGLMFKLTLYTLLFATLMHFGEDLVRHNLRLPYSGSGNILFFMAAGVLVLSRLSATRRRLIHYWRMSHEFDYAERRRRTQLLR